MKKTLSIFIASLMLLTILSSFFSVNASFGESTEITIINNENSNDGPYDDSLELTEELKLGDGDIDPVNNDPDNSYDMGVDDDWNGLPDGTEVRITRKSDPRIIGTDAFAKIQDAVDRAEELNGLYDLGVYIYVLPGRYFENIVIYGKTVITDI